MAILHQATLTPSKLELLDAYLTSVPGLLPFVNGELTQLGSYRFDDPAGDVGIETHILTSATGAVIHIPLTYRAAPVDGWDAWLAGTMQHSVLGPRWAYNACIDPVYVHEIVRVITQGDTEVEQFVQTPDGPVRRDNTASVQGSGGAEIPAITQVVPGEIGTTTTIDLGGATLTVVHVVGLGTTDKPHLTGQWIDTHAPRLLATLDV